MACKASFELYHNFPRLAEEAGFAFNTHRPRVHIEWNKIRLLDIDSLIRERKFILIEQHINDILDCVLESEFDIRILDEGVVKIFRLAQLAVEYQQYCRHYLDRSVFVLREEITSLAQELDANKRNLQEKEDEIKRIRRKSKHITRPPVSYGNENIATMILNTLRHQTDIFPSVAHLDTLQQNKCDICEKVFLNQLYLKSHILRRHPNATETPQKDRDHNTVVQPTSIENSNLLVEVADLKSKLKEMETLITQKHELNITDESHLKSNCNNGVKQETVKVMKDAEVLTQNQGDVLDKIQEWKEQEFNMYKNELQLLKSQLMCMINESKEKRNQNASKIERDSEIVEKLQMRIQEQGEELLKLKQELLDSKSLQAKIEVERKQEVQSQISNWAKKVEIQSNECKTLLQKLNEMAKDVQEHRAVANAERQKAIQLQGLLDEKLKESNIKHNDVIKKNTSSDKKPTADKNTLDKLQKKAQELLSMEKTSSSDSSTCSEDYNTMADYNSKLKHDTNHIGNAKEDKLKSHFIKKQNNSSVTDQNGKKLKPHNAVRCNANKKVKNKLKTIKSLRKENGHSSVPVSPIKLVRAKVTEEVNQRLVQLGVDPLKNRLPKSTFQKQRTMLLKQQEVKVKKYPSREKIYHSIQAHLNANTTNAAKNVSSNKETRLNSSSKINKTFSISTVLANVKSKALSFVKPHDIAKNESTHVLSKASFDGSHKSPQSSYITCKDLSSPTPSPNPNGSKGKGKKLHQLTKDVTKKYKSHLKNESNNESETESEEEMNKTIDSATNSLDEIVKSPIRKPTEPYKYKIETNMSKQKNYINDRSSDDVESIIETTPRKGFSEENISPKQTKSVLKNASSTSSLNKKKVLFDMDAIQMKSVSATPSQSLAENSDGTDKYTLGIYNLDAEEWDPSSIENENPKKSTIQVSTRASPKIAELKQAIESQMSRRIQTPSTVLAGSVDILPIPLVRSSIGGSNTSLGSSILDDSENLPPRSREQDKTLSVKQTLVKTKSFEENDDSEIDFSGLLADDKSDKF